MALLKKAVIWNNGIGVAGHSELVRHIFLENAPPDWTCEIWTPASLYAQIDYLPTEPYWISDSGGGVEADVMSSNAAIYIYPYTQGWADKEIFDLMRAAGMIVVAAHDADVNILAQDGLAPYYGPPCMYSAITCGFGQFENIYSYGRGLELTDYYYVLNTWGESLATPMTAARVAKIIDAHPEYNFWDIRQHLRQSCNLYPVWNMSSGFGVASDNSASVISLDLGIPTEMDATVSPDGSSVALTWAPFASTRYAGTKITQVSDGSLVYSGTGNYTRWVSDIAGTETFLFQTYDSLGNLSPINDAAKISATGLIAATARTTLPTVITNAVTSITASAATVAGDVTSDGGLDVTERGFCFNKTGNPTIADPHIAVGIGTGIFSVALSGLDASTDYYLCAYAENIKGTAYGSIVSFITGQAEAAPQYDGYCTQNGSTPGDIAPSRISIDLLHQLTNDAATSGSTSITIQSVVDNVIEWADDHINSLCGKRILVPMNPVPSKVKSLSADLATFKLFEKQAMNTGGAVPEVYQKMFDAADKFLHDVAKGIAVIDGAITPPAQPNLTGGSFSSGKRIFDDKSMREL